MCGWLCGVMVIRHHLLRSDCGHRRPFSCPAFAGHVAAYVHRRFLFCCCRFRSALLEETEQALRDVRDVWRETGRGEIEPEDHAHRGVQYFQAGIPAQDEYRRAQCQRCRERYRQLITSFPGLPAGWCPGRCQVSKLRDCLRRSQRARNRHFSHLSAPSAASAPHAHCRPLRHPFNSRPMLITSCQHSLAFRKVRSAKKRGGPTGVPRGDQALTWWRPSGSDLPAR